MAHQIVATSVPRGLDGVSGYQTVLKSAGIPPRVFDRLKARSGYSHRYPHGDSRNPVIYVHRIEELAGSRWHVLGCIRDAGSDHTGRSNFLAHMLAIDSAEARGKPGGPAAAALARGCFLDRWDRPPESAAAAKTLVVADRPAQPGDVPAWTAAELDPGLAGDLAAAAMANRKVVLVTRPGDDVLALFADALRLVEPSKRWGVTFNTCAIEDFDGTWKAVRADLAEAKNLRDGKAGVIDLTTDPRGSADPYAQFARGEAALLPWQKSVAEAEPEQIADESGKDAARQKLTTPGRQPADTARTARSKPATAGHGRLLDRRQAPDEEELRRLPWREITIAALGLLLVVTLAAIPFRYQIQEQIFGPSKVSKRIVVEPGTEVEVSRIIQPSRDPNEDPAYRASAELNKALDRLRQGVDGKTYLQHREEAEAFNVSLDNLRSGADGKPRLRIMPEDGDREDPRLAGENAVKVCNLVSKLLETSTGLDVKIVENAESHLKDSIASLARAKKQVDALIAKEQKELDDRTRAQEYAARQQRQRDAFVAFQSISQTVSLPTAHSASGADLGGPRPSTTGGNIELDLGPFQLADLLEPTFRLAVPRDNINGQAFKAEIGKVEGESDASWQIAYVPSAVAFKEGAAKSHRLALLIARDGRLFLRVTRSHLNWSPFAMLRRSVILVEAKDPSTPEAAAIRQEIRLVTPTKAQPLEIDLFADRPQSLEITPPDGIARTVGGPDGQATFVIPISSLRVEADFPNGEAVNFEVPKDVQRGTDPVIRSWDNLPLADIQLDENRPSHRLKINATVKFSLPQATITSRTAWSNPPWVTKDKVKEFYIDNPEQKLRYLNGKFRGMLEAGRKFRLSDGQTKPKTIMDWFSLALVDANWNMGVPMPGHETIQNSFEIFLKEQRDKAPDGLKPGQRPDLPQSYDQFCNLCREVMDEPQWQQVFTDRIDKWSEWFWPQFKKQWDANVKLIQGGLAVEHKVRIKAITSLAYDENGEMYEVPLIVGENPNPAPGVGPGPGLDGDAPTTQDGPPAPPSAAGASGSVGLE